MATSATAIAKLAEAVSVLNRPKVPAPAPFTGVGKIECFFREFERYAKTRYGENLHSYLRSLPDFLTGEALSLLKAFGSGSNVTYDVVKARIIQDLNDRKSIVHNSFADFVGMKREPDESLPCYRIRLEMAADDFTEACAEAREIMVYTKVVDALPKRIINQLDLQCAVLGKLSLDRVICMASAMETFTCESGGADEAVVEQCSSNVPEKQESAERSDGSAQQVSGSRDAGNTHRVRTVLRTRVSCVRQFRRSNRFDGKCNHCGKVGHIARRCYERRRKLSGSERAVAQCNSIEQYTLMNRQCGTDGRVACPVEFGESPALLSDAMGSWEVCSDSSSTYQECTAPQYNWDELPFGIRRN